MEESRPLSDSGGIFHLPTDLFPGQDADNALGGELSLSSPLEENLGGGGGDSNPAPPEPRVTVSLPLSAISQSASEQLLASALAGPNSTFGSLFLVAESDLRALSNFAAAAGSNRAGAGGDCCIFRDGNSESAKDGGDRLCTNLAESSSPSAVVVPKPCAASSLPSGKGSSVRLPVNSAWRVIVGAAVCSKRKLVAEALLSDSRVAFDLSPKRFGPFTTLNSVVAAVVLVLAFFSSAAFTLFAEWNGRLAAVFVAGAVVSAALPWFAFAGRTDKSTSRRQRLLLPTGCVKRRRRKGARADASKETSALGVAGASDGDAGAPQERGIPGNGSVQSIRAAAQEVPSILSAETTTSPSETEPLGMETPPGWAPCSIPSCCPINDAAPGAWVEGGKSPNVCSRAGEYWRQAGRDAASLNSAVSLHSTRAGSSLDAAFISSAGPLEGVVSGVVHGVPGETGAAGGVVPGNVVEAGGPVFWGADGECFGMLRPSVPLSGYCYVTTPQAGSLSVPPVGPAVFDAPAVAAATGVVAPEFYSATTASAISVGGNGGGVLDSAISTQITHALGATVAAAPGAAGSSESSGGLDPLPPEVHAPTAHPDLDTEASKAPDFCRARGVASLPAAWSCVDACGELAVAGDAAASSTLILLDAGGDCCFNPRKTLTLVARAAAACAAAGGDGRLPPLEGAAAAAAAASFVREAEGGGESLSLVDTVRGTVSQLTTALLTQVGFIFPEGNSPPSAALNSDSSVKSFHAAPGIFDLSGCFPLSEYQHYYGLSPALRTVFTSGPGSPEASTKLLDLSAAREVVEAGNSLWDFFSDLYEVLAGQRLVSADRTWATISTRLPSPFIREVLDLDTLRIAVTVTKNLIEWCGGNGGCGKRIVPDEVTRFLKRLFVLYFSVVPDPRDGSVCVDGRHVAFLELGVSCYLLIGSEEALTLTRFICERYVSFMFPSNVSRCLAVSLRSTIGVQFVNLVESIYKVPLASEPAEKARVRQACKDRLWPYLISTRVQMRMYEEALGLLETYLAAGGVMPETMRSAVLELGFGCQRADIIAAAEERAPLGVPTEGRAAAAGSVSGAHHFRRQTQLLYALVRNNNTARADAIFDELIYGPPPVRDAGDAVELLVPLLEVAASVSLQRSVQVLDVAAAWKCLQPRFLNIAIHELAKFAGEAVLAAKQLVRILREAATAGPGAGGMVAAKPGAAAASLSRAGVDAAIPGGAIFSGVVITPLLAAVAALDLDAAWRFVSDLRELGITLDKYSSGVLIGRVRAGSSAWVKQKSVALMEEFRLNVVTDAVLLSTVVDACARLRDYGRLRKVLENSRGETGGGAARPSVHASGTLIKAYGRCRDVEAAWSVWNDLTDARGLEPSSYTLGCMCDTLVSNGRLDDALDLFERFAGATGGVPRPRALAPSTIHYSILIKGCAHQRRVGKALELFDEMERRGIWCNEITYNSLVNACIASGELERAEDIVAKMEKGVVSIAPSPGSVAGDQLETADAGASARDHAQCSDRTVVGPLAAAFGRQAFSAADDDDSSAGGSSSAFGAPVRPDVITYSTLIKGLCAVGNVDRAIAVLRRMSRPPLSLKPDVILYNTLLEGCAKKNLLGLAETLLQEMVEEEGLSPSNYTLSILIKLFGRHHRLDRALAVAEELPRRFNFTVDAFVYTALIAACLLNNDTDRALDFFAKMNSQPSINNSLITGRIFSTVIQGCLKAGRVVEAFDLLIEAVVSRRLKMDLAIILRLKQAINGASDASGSFASSRPPVTRAATFNSSSLRTLCADKCRQAQQLSEMGAWLDDLITANARDFKQLARLSETASGGRVNPAGLVLQLPERPPPSFLSHENSATYPTDGQRGGFDTFRSDVPEIMGTPSPVARRRMRPTASGRKSRCAFDNEPTLYPQQSWRQTDGPSHARRL